MLVIERFVLKKVSVIFFLIGDESFNKFIIMTRINLSIIRIYLSTSHNSFVKFYLVQTTIFIVRDQELGAKELFLYSKSDFYTPFR